MKNKRADSSNGRRAALFQVASAPILLLIKKCGLVLSTVASKLNSTGNLLSRFPAAVRCFVNYAYHDSVWRVATAILTASVIYIGVVPSIATESTELDRILDDERVFMSDLVAAMRHLETTLSVEKEFYLIVDEVQVSILDGARQKSLGHDLTGALTRVDFAFKRADHFNTELNVLATRISNTKFNSSQATPLPPIMSLAAGYVTDIQKRVQLISGIRNAADSGKVEAILKSIEAAKSRLNEQRQSEAQRGPETEAISENFVREFGGRLLHTQTLINDYERRKQILNFKYYVLIAAIFYIISFALICFVGIVGHVVNSTPSESDSQEETKRNSRF
jgi:hypothetical protein